MAAKKNPSALLSKALDLDESNPGAHGNAKPDWDDRLNLAMAIVQGKVSMKAARIAMKNAGYRGQPDNTLALTLWTAARRGVVSVERT